MLVDALLRAYPLLGRFVTPLPPERQDGAEFCDWGSAIGSRRPMCRELAQWLVEGDSYCERHTAALARSLLLAMIQPSDLPQGDDTPTTDWRAALQREEVDLLPRETREQLDVLADVMPLSGTGSEAALGAWLLTAQQAGLLTRAERSAIDAAVAEAIYTAADQAMTPPARGRP